ncbi:MAG: hypothetical protein VW625_03655 [Perlucidibaca sp.]
MTFLHYVCRSPYDGRELSQPTTDRNKAMRDLERLRQEYRSAVLATICVDDDEPEAA